MTSHMSPDPFDGRAADPQGAVGAADSGISAAAQAVLAALAGPDAVLRRDQAAAISALVRDRRRVLVVQRTGWGKSAVYFAATKLLRDRGAGPTLLVSPLLALMRDQIEAAARAGIRAATINSTNLDEWSAIEAEVAADRVDVLLISPERLNAPGFRSTVLPQIADRVGLLVVDEAHCISDWGHDFRPDYRRISATVLPALPEGTPVLATTATANDRVAADVLAQLGTDTVELRGELDRQTLRLSVIDLPAAAQRLAWLAEWIPTVPGSGIVYTLTVGDAERVAAWLASRGISAVAYSGKTPPEDRLRIEEDLKGNAVKVVVSTTALSMGFDKPDLAFVVHHGSPSSPIAYYQMVGRAGRALPDGAHADAVLLPGGAADTAVWDFFERMAFPPRDAVEQVLATLRAATAAGETVSVAELEQSVNLRRTRLEAMLKILDVEGAVTYVPGRGGGWRTTDEVDAWTYDGERYAAVTAARRAEAEAMRRYAGAEGCLMRFLLDELDDPAVAAAGPGQWRCGRCAVCTGIQPGPAVLDAGTVQDATAFLRAGDVVVEPRRQWPRGLAAEHVHAGRRGNIKPHLRAEDGRALLFGTDPGWHEAVTGALDAAGPVPDEVYEGVEAMLARWDWPVRPSWVTFVPSRRRPALVAGLAARIAERGRLDLREVVVRRSETPPQGSFRNSAHQAGAALDAWVVDPDADGGGPVPEGACLLVDDVTASGWTLTVVAALLREAGSGPVLPVVLHRQP
jgi:ATP-dependent DNA helicase RecQ